MAIFGKSKKNNYFQMFCDNLNFAKQSIDYLKKALINFDSNKVVLEKQLKELHAIEHAADESQHKLMTKLAKEFITPIEQEDIIELSKVIDDIIDQIEDVLQQIYIYGVTTIRPDVIEFIELLEKCLDKLEHIFSEFKHFKRSDTIHQAIADLNRYEEDADDLYIEAMRKLFEEKETSSPITIFSWSEIYYQLELCSDTCDAAGNLVAEVIMKNS